MSSMGATIKAIRKRLGKSQEEFARVLACRHNTVSRYELDKFVPGTGALVRPYDLALPGEKKLLAEEIKRQIGTGIVSRDATIEAPIEELRPLLDELATFDALVGRLRIKKSAEFRDPEQAAFARLASQIPLIILILCFSP
jgi:transcriptional regulator with XRE-family HTH domain